MFLLLLLLHSQVGAAVRGGGADDGGSEPLPAGELLPMRDPVSVGHEALFESALVGERALVVRTLSASPAVFEVPDFLSAVECAAVVRVSRETEGVMRDSGQRWRRSSHGWVRLRGAMGKRLQARASALAALPTAILEASEPMQVVRYQAGGHYHAHHDSTPPHTARFATLLIYLSDTTGGETAFPLAPRPGEAAERCAARRAVTPTDQNFAAHSEFNLSTRAGCEAGLAVRPARGKAVLFYNHAAANATHLGAVEAAALHGGCDVAPGAPDKWIANLWFNVPGEQAQLEAKRAAAASGGMGARELMDEFEAAFESMRKMSDEEQLAYAQQLREALDRDDEKAKAVEAQPDADTDTTERK